MSTAQCDEMVGRVVLELRELIPAVTCVAGCHDCCGAAPCTHWERERMGPCLDTELRTAGMCPWLGPEGCTCYDERPIICRLYAVIPELRCPHGVRPRPALSPEVRASIVARYRLAVELDRLAHVAAPEVRA